MANIIKGFMQIPELVDNTVGVNAVIGELSMTSRTYAREKQYVALDAQPGLQFIAFSAETDTGIDISDLTGTYCQSALEVVNLIRYNYDNAEELSIYLSNNLDAAFTAISYGAIITQDGINLPEYIQFTHTDNGGTTFKVWLSDAAFQEQWDESETYVLPPVADINDLYQGHAVAEPIAGSYTFSQRLSAINAVTRVYPPTDQITYTLKWQDPADINLQFETVWTVLGHGVDSTRTDKVLEAIRAYLVNNTTHTEEDWKVYFPDIETLDVFSLIPLWDSLALYTGVSGPSVARPVFKVSELAGIATNMLVGRTETEWDGLGECFPVLYKWYPVLAMPGSSNAEATRSFLGVFPDYTLAVLNTQTGNRLSAATQAVLSAIDSLIRAAEVDTGSLELPTGISRNAINGVKFLEKSVNDIVYRMVTKESYIARV